MARPALAATLVALLVGLACRGEGTRLPERAGERDGDPAHAGLDADPGGDPDASDTLEAGAHDERPRYAPPSTLAEPLAIHRSKRSRMVYAEPNHDALERGRIPAKQSFHVFEEREGPRCDRAWAKVAEAAWVCLERTEPSELPPQPLPELEEGATLPFLYARHKQHQDPSTPAIPVYGSTSSYREGAEPIATRPAYGSYAFTRYRPNHGDPILITTDRRAVPAAELEQFEASEFGGRELAQQPIAAGETLAWAVRWKTLVRAAPDRSAKQIARVQYHHTLTVIGEGVLGPGKDGEQERWFEVPASAGQAGGWIRAHDIRRFVPVPPPTPVLGGQVTIDVDLDEQVLSVWVEDTPTFVTLVSSGKRRDETPTGLFRVQTKRAYGKMESVAGARDPYFVEAVPWAMYFRGRYAFHASYWHDMFGHRMSHGCVNLSPRDAKRVFELASPTLPAGWLLVYEHPRDPGALVRVRRAGQPSPDLRRPPESTTG